MFCCFWLLNIQTLKIRFFWISFPVSDNLFFWWKTTATVREETRSCQGGVLRTHTKTPNVFTIYKNTKCVHNLQKHQMCSQFLTKTPIAFTVYKKNTKCVHNLQKLLSFLKGVSQNVFTISFLFLQRGFAKCKFVSLRA